MNEKIEEFRQKLLNIQPISLFDYKDVIPELLPLEQTQQSKDWHREGNVLIHTNMVLEKAYQLCQNLEDNHKLNVYFGSLLHDFGKQNTTFTKVNKDGSTKVVAYGHESAGVPIVRSFLRKYFPEFNYNQREEILSLVEFHKEPKWMVVNNVDDMAFKKLSLDVNTLELYNVEVADFTGRIGMSADSSLQHLETFKQKCQDLNIWDEYYTLPDSALLHRFGYNQARWNVLFNHADEASAVKKYENYRSVEHELMILIGPPASGKTTYAQTIFPHVETICMDQERELLGDINDMNHNQEVYEKCFRRLCDRMRSKKSVIWDATSCTRKVRKRLIDVARAHGAGITLVHFDLPLETLLERNAKRDRQVPEDVVKSFYNKLQSPKPVELDRLFIVDK